MTFPARTKLYSTEDCKVAQLLTDPEGGPATYGDLIDVPGIRQVKLTPQIESKQLRGDNRELDSDSVLVAAEISWDQGELSWEALVAILGGTYADGRYVRTGADVIPQFKMIWKTPAGGASGGGDVHFGVAKARVTAFSLGTAFEDYQIMSGTARCVYRLSDDELFDLTPHEAATAISA